MPSAPEIRRPLAPVSRHVTHRLGERWIPNRPECLGSVRRFVRDLAADWGVPPEAAETAELLTNELVTNAIKYGGPDAAVIRISISRTGDLLCVDVHDANPATPRITIAGDDDLSGRGLSIVALLAQDFGWTPQPDGGKTVWFECTAWPE